MFVVKLSNHTKFSTNSEFHVSLSNYKWLQNVRLFYKITKLQSPKGSAIMILFYIVNYIFVSMTTFADKLVPFV